MNIVDALRSNADRYLLDLAEEEVFTSFSHAGRQSWRATPHGPSAARLATPDGPLHNPGPLLPDNDVDARDYGSRLRDKGLSRWHLQVEDPWVFESAKWLEMRRVLDLLWGVVGFPVVPVKISIGVHNGSPLTNERTDSMQIVWPYRDGPHGKHSDQPFVIPPFHDGSRRSRVMSPGADGSRTNEPLVMVSATISTDPRRPVEMVMEQASNYMSKAEGALDVPYTPYPAGESVGGIPTPLLSSPLVQLGGALQGLSTDAKFLKRLHLRWLRLVSAACIRAVPEPLEPEAISIQDGARYRQVSRIVFHQEQSGEGICAANGHVFSVRGRRAAGVIEAISSGSAFSVPWLCDDARIQTETRVGREGPEREVGNLVSRLVALRAVGKVNDAG